MRPTKTLISALFLLTACATSEPFDPFGEDHTGMEVEAIPYDLLGATKLFFSRMEPGAFGTIALDGSSGTAAITYPARGEWVAVHPTTRMITYMSNLSTPSQRYSEVWVRGWASAEGQPLGGPGGSRYDPSWTPDGARVIYTESDHLSGFQSLFGNRIISQSPATHASDRLVLWSG